MLLFLTPNISSILNMNELNYGREMDINTEEMQNIR
jgi:hypothetical protein